MARAWYRGAVARGIRFAGLARGSCPEWRCMSDMARGAQRSPDDWRVAGAGLSAGGCVPPARDHPTQALSLEVAIRWHGDIGRADIEGFGRREPAAEKAACGIDAGCLGAEGSVGKNSSRPRRACGLIEVAPKTVWREPVPGDDTHHRAAFPSNLPVMALITDVEADLKLLICLGRQGCGPTRSCRLQACQSSSRMTAGMMFPAPDCRAQTSGVHPASEGGDHHANGSRKVTVAIRCPALPA